FLFLASSAIAQGVLAQMRWVPLSLTASPSARGAPAMAYDPVNREVVLFGGVNAAGRQLADPGGRRGRGGTHRPPPLAPPARAAAGIAWDAPTQRLVLFGGYEGGWAGTWFGDTWTFDGVSGTWAQESPSFSPPAGSGPSLFTDPLDGHAVAF